MDLRPEYKKLNNEHERNSVEKQALFNLPAPYLHTLRYRCRSGRIIK